MDLKTLLKTTFVSNTDENINLSVLVLSSLLAQSLIPSHIDLLHILLKDLFSLLPLFLYILYLSSYNLFSNLFGPIFTFLLLLCPLGSIARLMILWLVQAIDSLTRNKRIILVLPFKLL